jgi:hypothetical protein
MGSAVRQGRGENLSLSESEVITESSHCKKRLTIFLYKLFPARESLVVTSRLGTGKSQTFFYSALKADAMHKTKQINQLFNIIKVLKIIARYMK